MNQNILAPRGTQDLFGKRAYRWHEIKKIIRNIMDLYGLSEIITPTFEYTELFERSVGEETDVVQKEMYTFLDKGGRSITMRPEGTAGAVRACIQNNLLQGNLPLKLFYFANCFRYEKPQAGRFRELNQFGVEVFGASGAEIEVDMISMLMRIFAEFKITRGLTLAINSIGCKVCRKSYVDALNEYFAKHKESYCSTCQTRMNKNLLRVLDCKQEKCTALNETAPKITEYLCPDCKKEFIRLQNLLQLNGIAFKIDNKLVRGLDYYNRTVFEFIARTPDGNNLAVLGGGRYDDLVQSLGGPQTPAFGFGMGLERLLMLLEEQNYEFSTPKSCDVFIVNASKENPDAETLAWQLLADLRKQNMASELDVMQRSVKAQFKYADKINANFCIVIGEDECKTKMLTLKNMKNSEEKQMVYEEVLNYLCQQQQ